MVGPTVFRLVWAGRASLAGATRALALDLINSIKKEIETNELLAEDFPEVCYPVAQLEGEGRRCIGQRHRGARKHIIWKQDEIWLPKIEGSLASEAINCVASITGAIRGRKFMRSDGRIVRPGFVFLDDPQTDKSARSRIQTNQREER